MLSCACVTGPGAAGSANVFSPASKKANPSIPEHHDFKPPGNWRDQRFVDGRANTAPGLEKDLGFARRITWLT
jgi:hypothetical protein